jgi:hypothetical protein
MDSPNSPAGVWTRHTARCPGRPRRAAAAAVVLAALGAARPLHAQGSPAPDTAAAAAVAPPGPDTAAVDSVVAAARAAARGDRNAEAAARFEEAIRRDPARRPALVRELADQLTYSDRARRAVPLYREALARPLPADEERRARAGLALALSWSGQLGAAEREYGRLLAAPPAGDEAARRDAERGLARVLVWRGRHRAGQARLRALLAAAPDDREARLLLAQSEHWMGRTDRALGTLDALLARDAGHAGARRFRDEVGRALRPSTRLDVQRSTQSDALGITAATVTHAVPLRGRGAVEPRFEQRRFAPGGDPRAAVVVPRPSVYARARLSDALELNVVPGAEVISRAGAGRGRTVAVYDAWLTFWPGDRVRLDASSGRSTFDNVGSLLSVTTQTSFALSGDVLPDERTRLTLRGTAARISDGNRRWGGQGEVERELWGRPHVYLGARAERYHFSRGQLGPYFSPSRYTSALATARAWAAVADRLWWNADVAYGGEDALPGGRRPRWSGGARLNYVAGRALELEARYAYFSSRQVFGAFGTAFGSPDPTGGFSRGTAGVAARVRW